MTTQRDMDKDIDIATAETLKEVEVAMLENRKETIALTPSVLYAQLLIRLLQNDNVDCQEFAGQEILKLASKLDSSDELIDVANDSEAWQYHLIVRRFMALRDKARGWPYNPRYI